MGKRKQQLTDDILVCDGIYIGKSLLEEKENRLLTLLLKGFTVYLLTMGSIGFYLSAFQINYNVMLTHMVIFVVSICCAMLFYRLMVENIGYLIIFVSFAALVMRYRLYINSGFYAVVNITVANASTYLDVDVQRLYTEKITDRYTTITLFALFLGVVLGILFNVYISRRMKYAGVFNIIMFINVVPLYLVLEPDALYALMVLCGMAMAYVFRSGKHYSPQLNMRRTSNRYKLKIKGRGKRKIENIDYVYDIKSMLQAGAWAFAFAFVIIIGVRRVKPVDNFNVGYEQNKYKEVSMAGISTFMLEGFRGFSRYTADVAGLDSGKLGDVASVRVDGQTDIILQFTPYSYDTLYIKSFVGDVYNPYENNWTSITDIRGYNGGAEATAYKEYYESGAEDAAIAYMRQRPIDTRGMAFMYPYYYSSDTNEKNGYYKIEYYPYLKDSAVYVDPANYDGDPVLETDLAVPSENAQAIDEFLDNLGWIGNDSENIQAVIDYFQNNIPYTIKPGKTPNKKDFVNYFLQENKKGYCAHFASAAVLIFRSMGIPARYVEGYAVSFDQVTLTGELVEDANYDDYYKGYNELGETALVQVNVTDADAHAWVEVYQEGKGWIVVDVTPTSDEEENTDSFWDSFDRIMNNNNGGGDDNANQAINIGISDKVVKGISNTIAVIFLLFVIAILMLKGYKVIIINIRYARADNSDKLIIKYSDKMKRIRKKCKNFVSCYDYHTQLEFIRQNNVDDMESYKLEEMTNDKTADGRFITDDKYIRLEEILKVAGFSGREISSEELSFALGWLRGIKPSRIVRYMKYTQKNNRD